jgi:RimJ/RimL family protein N-acetyltransferase
MEAPISPLVYVEIESDRLRLLPTSEEYAREVFHNFTPAITEFMFPAPPNAIEETLAFLRGAHESILAGTDLQVVILLKEDEEFLGHGGIHHVDTRTPELGIWIKLSAHGDGYGREAVTALAEWALENLEFDYLIYPVDRRNLPSRKIPESLGGRIEAEYEVTNESGDVLDIVEYRIYPDDLRAILEGRE